MHRQHINKIISSKDDDSMEELKNLLIDIIEYVKMVDIDKYEEIEKDLYEISEGKVLNKEMAEKIIQHMKPYGMKWTLEETNTVKEDKNLGKISPIDFWIVMNSAYNDYHNLFKEDMDMYINWSKEFILDEDAVECKVYEYFTTIPKNVHK